MSDGAKTLAIYHYAGNMHNPGMLMVYLPKEKILFQADLLNAAPNGTFPIAPDATVSFSENLQKLGLAVEKIYGVHGRFATPEELRTSIEKRRASELKITGSGSH